MNNQHKLQPTDFPAKWISGPGISVFVTTTIDPEIIIEGLVKAGGYDATDFTVNNVRMKVTEFLDKVTPASDKDLQEAVGACLEGLKSAR